MIARAVRGRVGADGRRCWVVSGLVIGAGHRNIVVGVGERVTGIRTSWKIRQKTVVMCCDHSFGHRAEERTAVAICKGECKLEISAHDTQARHHNLLTRQNQQPSPTPRHQRPRELMKASDRVW